VCACVCVCVCVCVSECVYGCACVGVLVCVCVCSCVPEYAGSCLCRPTETRRISAGICSRGYNKRGFFWQKPVCVYFFFHFFILFFHSQANAAEGTTSAGTHGHIGELNTRTPPLNSRVSLCEFRILRTLLSFISRECLGLRTLCVVYEEPSTVCI
jgi:hypothetical protein